MCLDFVRFLGACVCILRAAIGVITDFDWRK